MISQHTKTDPTLNTLIVGHGGREAALGWRMAEHSRLFAFMKHENPSLLAYTERTGGAFGIGDICDPDAVLRFAQQHKIDLVMISCDDPLAAGVVDCLLAHEIPTVGPTKAGAEVEWNKIFSRALLEEVAPQANPFFKVAHSAADVDTIFQAIGREFDVVVKPVGLTGGKGVRVMGPHLADHEAAKQYALDILGQDDATDATVIIEEKIDGIEFTIQAITDGYTVVFPPATYDYPYRFAGDEGPGTGGMGSFNDATLHLPFITPSVYQQACDLIQQVIDALRAQGRHFTGTLNSGFFITPGGQLKVIEFNARFGDPECINIMSILESNWVSVMQKLANQTLTKTDLQFSDQASVMVYLVSPEYALAPGKTHGFTVDVHAIEADGCHAFFASTIKNRSAFNGYQTLGTSRALGIAAARPTLEAAREAVYTCIDRHIDGPLQCREDIASAEYMGHLTQHTRVV